MNDPSQNDVDFCASKTMEWLGTLPMPEARRFLSGFLMLTPANSSVVLPFRHLFERLTQAEECRAAIATGQLTLNLVEVGK